MVAVALLSVPALARAATESDFKPQNEFALEP